MARRILVTLALVLGGIFIYVIGAFAGALIPLPTPAAVDAAFAAESALATAQGLVVTEDDPGVERQLVRSVPLAAGECVAVVAAMQGVGPIVAQLEIDGAQSSATSDVAHVAACAVSAGDASISVNWNVDDRLALPQRARVAIFRGHVQSPRTYTRLWTRPEQRAAFDAAAVRARVAARASAVIGAPQVADSAHAVLFPAERAAFAALRSLTGRADLAPAVVGDAIDPFATASDVPTAPRVFGPTSQERALAVVDAGALASCIAVTFAELDDPLTATPIHRTSIPDRARVDVEAIDGAIAIDRVCPATGLFVYTTDAHVGAELEVSVARGDADGATEVGPSHFASERLVVLPIPYLDATRSACTGGDVDACFALASLARDGMIGAGTIGEALEPLCRASGGAACDALAGSLEGSPDADALEQRACATGTTPACMRRGARFLAAASDLDRAYRTFRFGCTHGGTDCCTAAASMRDWQLAPADAPDDPSEPG